MKYSIVEWNEYNQPNLLQRLKAPFENKVFVVNPFSFGGGGSGLSREAAKMLNDIWEFDYMGAAEYEFGAAAGALATIADYAHNNELTTVSLTLKPSDFKLPWKAELEVKRKRTPKTKQAAIDSFLSKYSNIEVYAICHKTYVKKIEDFVRDLASEKVKTRDVLEMSMFKDPKREDYRTRGWLSVGDRYPKFLMFVDLDMFNKAKSIFGLGEKSTNVEP